MSDSDRRGAERPPEGSAQSPRAADRSPAGAVLARLDEVEVEVEKLVAGGDGLARVGTVPIFVPRSAPGDRLRVRLTERRPDYGRAEIVEVLEAGPGRREPPCPHFERCGGCDLQHLEDDLQTRLKADAVRETLLRLGGVRLPETVEVLSAQPWGYRLRTRLHTSASDSGVAVGYYARKSHDLVPIEACAVCVPALERAAVALSAELDLEAPRRIDLACGDGDEITSAPVVAGLPHGEVRLVVAGIEMAFDARCFFQTHAGLLEDLVRVVVGDWTGEELFDLYGGVGLFALAAAGRYDRVTTIDSDRVATRYARINARRNRLPNVEVVSRAVESWMAELPEGADRVIVDPPRAGLSRGVRQLLQERRPRRLTYVSCHAATMARDLRYLERGFELDGIALLDMFPQTGHMEVVGQLRRRDAG